VQVHSANGLHGIFKFLESLGSTAYTTKSGPIYTCAGFGTLQYKIVLCYTLYVIQSVSL
jgi:hypothetical protein